MNDKQADAVDRRIDKLQALITLPAVPTEVWFSQVPRGVDGRIGPNDYLLVAVMRFERADLARIIANAARRPGSRISSTANRPWFPEAVRVAIRPYDDHSATVRGDKFDAAPFARSPFLTGTFMVIEGGEYVILTLQTS